MRLAAMIQFLFCLVAFPAFAQPAAPGAAPPMAWTYVQNGKGNTYALPPDFYLCDSGDSKVSIAAEDQQVRVFRATGTPTDRQQVLERECPEKATLVSVSVGGTVVQESDIERYAFAQSSSDPTKLDVIVQFKGSVSRDAMVETVFRLAGTEHLAKFVGVKVPNLYLWTFEALPEDLAKFGGQLEIDTDHALLSPTDGKRWSQVIPPKQKETWLAQDPILLKFAKPQVGHTQQRVTARSTALLRRFLDRGSFKCASDGNRSVFCDLEFVEGDVRLLVDESDLVFLAQSKRLVFPTPSVELARISGGKLTIAGTDQGVVALIEVSQCEYKIKQLTRLEAGLAAAESYLEVERTSGSEDLCPEQYWTAEVEGEGDAGVVSSGRLEFDQDDRKLAKVVFAQLPNVGTVAKTYAMRFRYDGGRAVALSTASNLLIEPETDLRGALHVDFELSSTEDVNITGKDLIAANRRNILSIASDGIGRWTLTRVPDAEVGFGEASNCRHTPADNLCLIPLGETTRTLKLRAELKAQKDRLKLDRDLPASIPNEIVLGTNTFDTNRIAKFYRLAVDLQADAFVKCGDRKITAMSDGLPVSVGYQDFEDCTLYVRAASFPRSQDQVLIVEAGEVPTSGAIKYVSLGAVRTAALSTKACPGEPENQCVEFPLSMRKAAGGDEKPYGVVEIRVTQKTSHYFEDELRSYPDRSLVVEVRRRPRCLRCAPASSVDTKNPLGYRLYLTATISPFTLFRAPHSGRSARRSSQLNDLETASFGAGILSVFEFWHFDANTPLFEIPFLSPQLQAGVLTTLPRPSDNTKAIPALSLVAGVALRSTAGTSAGSTVESSVKFLVWYERLYTFDGSRSNGTNNLLFGFGADIGALGN